MADKAGYTESRLRKFKENPRNKTHVGLEEGFFVNNKDLVVNIGRNKLINTPRVIIINESVDIISVKKGNHTEVLLDVNFYDKNNNLVARISENSWTVFVESI
jgi:hypothetical protein